MRICLMLPNEYSLIGLAIGMFITYILIGVIIPAVARRVT